MALEQFPPIFIEGPSNAAGAAAGSTAAGAGAGGLMNAFSAFAPIVGPVIGGLFALHSLLKDKTNYYEKAAKMQEEARNSPGNAALLQNMYGALNTRTDQENLRSNFLTQSGLTSDKVPGLAPDTTTTSYQNQFNTPYRDANGNMVSNFKTGLQDDARYTPDSVKALQDFITNFNSQQSQTGPSLNIDPNAFNAELTQGNTMSNFALPSANGGQGAAQGTAQAGIGSGIGANALANSMQVTPGNGSGVMGSFSQGGSNQPGQGAGTGMGAAEGMGSNGPSGGKESSVNAPGSGLGNLVQTLAGGNIGMAMQNLFGQGGNPMDRFKLPDQQPNVIQSPGYGFGMNGNNFQYGNEAGGMVNRGKKLLGLQQQNDMIQNSDAETTQIGQSSPQGGR